MKVYLSHGGGVNSWALYLHCIDDGMVPDVDFEAVFVDHDTDWPETYEYMQMMIAKGYPVTVLKPNHRGFDNLYDCCVARKILPSRQRRWCTHEFKIIPLINYYQTPSVELIGFDASEKTRIGMHEKNGVTKDFPLIAAGIDRQGCIDLIERHGLPVPPKSGCWLCPFQSRAQWVELKRRHPDLFCKVVQLENLRNERRAAAGKKPIYFRDIPLELLILPKDSSGRRATSDITLFDPDFDKPPCRCML